MRVLALLALMLLPSAGWSQANLAPAPPIRTPVNDNQAANKAYVDTAFATRAPLASPALVGTPTAPTPAEGAASSQIATTQYLDRLIPWLPRVHSGLGGTSSGHQLVWGDQNWVISHDRMKQVSHDGAMAVGMSVAGTGTAGDVVGIRWRLRNQTTGAWQTFAPSVTLTGGETAAQIARKVCDAQVANAALNAGLAAFKDLVGATYVSTEAGCANQILGNVYIFTQPFDASAQESLAVAGGTPGVVTKTAHGITSGQVVFFDSVTGLSGVSVDRAYYAIVTGPNTFTLSATLGGAPIAITGSATVGMTIGTVSPIVTSSTVSVASSSLAYMADHSRPRVDGNPTFQQVRYLYGRNWQGGDIAGQHIVEVDNGQGANFFASTTVTAFDDPTSTHVDHGNMQGGYGNSVMRLGKGLNVLSGYKLCATDTYGYITACGMTIGGPATITSSSTNTTYLTLCNTSSGETCWNVQIPGSGVPGRTGNLEILLAGTGIGIAITPSGHLVRTVFSTPASSSSPCTAGEETRDANYSYLCVAANTWKRSALSGDTW